MQRWSVIKRICVTPGAEGIPTYGVQVILPSGDIWRWEDVDVDSTVVAALVSRLQAVQPDECHFRDVVLDFIEEMASKV